jgi:(E)-4-hydroxy-3-methylbut-2-enyl-diphosphate synthase
VVHIGNVPMGGDNPIRIQSMANTSTLDTDASVKQCIRIIEAGGEYVRLTAQGVREAENLGRIKAGLRNSGYDTPLIADIHFNPNAACTSARIVEKVRINPGNFVDSLKTFKSYDYTEEEYQLEIEKIRLRFIPFLDICKEHHTAIRIGVNHGSLSDRIMSRYGDTPEGMVESCMEFLRICVSENFSDVVLSIKASNTTVMVATVRLLVRKMEAENMAFPIHLGITEAGDGEAGRIKSAVGIGAMLLEGIGDTIRVSLSEDPEAEIPVARKLLAFVEEKASFAENFSGEYSFDYQTDRYNFPPIVIADYSQTPVFVPDANLLPDFLYLGSNRYLAVPDNQKVIIDFKAFSGKKNSFPLFSIHEKEAWISCESPLPFLALDYAALDVECMTLLKQKPQTCIVLSASQNNIYEQKYFIHKLLEAQLENTVIIRQTYDERNLEDFQIRAALDCGFFFIDRLANGIFLQNREKEISPADINSCSFGILQATGRRISRTEYIACPSCGRTLFNLQSTLEKIKTATEHLKGLKIGVMGCIVNGLGEMADADYGYVGMGAGKISLFRGKVCVKKNIPEADAVDELLRLIAIQL